MSVHRWWHLRSEYRASDGMLYLRCATCLNPLRSVPDTGYRCDVCDSAFCDPMEHH